MNVLPLPEGPNRTETEWLTRWLWTSQCCPGAVRGHHLTRMVEGRSGDDRLRFHTHGLRPVRGLHLKPPELAPVVNHRC
jgi:hypothetical protein